MRKPLNLKDLGKTPASVTLPETPFERGIGADASRPFPSQPPKVQDGPKREFPMNASQAPTIGGYDAKNEPPKINAKPWQIAVQNARAQRAKEIGVGDITKDRAATVAETASQWMIQRQQLEQQLDPQTARIDAAQQALEALFAQRPELAEQAKLMFPNEAQLGVAGLAALLQPGRAFESLAKPFQFQQQEQARQQQLNNQQFASDREEWGMMYQRATNNLNSEYRMEETRLDNVGKSIQSFDDLTADLNSQEQQNFRAQLAANSKYTLEQLKGAQALARTELQEIARMARTIAMSPEEEAARVQAKLIEGGVDPQTAFQIAWAEVSSAYYKNQKAQQEIDQAAQLFPLEMRQAVMNLVKTQEDIRAIAARADYTTAQTSLMGREFALRQLEHALNVEKFNQGLSQNAKDYDLLVAEKLFSSQRAYATLLEEQLKNANAQVAAADRGTPEYEAAFARVQQLDAQLAKTRQDILAAQKAIETLGKKPIQNPDGQVNLTFGTVPGGAAASGGGFRPQQVEAATKNVVCRSGAQCAEGLTQALQNLGFDIPTMLGAQQTAQWAIRNGGQIVTDPQPGDIVWVQGPGYGGVQAGGRRSGHHVEMYAGNGYVWNRRNGRWTKDRVSRHTNGRVTFIRLPQ